MTGCALYPGSNLLRAVHVTGPALRHAQAASAAVSSRHERQPLEQMHVLLVLEQRAVQRRGQPLRIPPAHQLPAGGLAPQEPEPAEQPPGRRLLFFRRTLAPLAEKPPRPPA